MPHQHPVQTQWTHRVWFTRDAFEGGNPALANALRPPLLDQPGKLLVIVDQALPNAIDGLQQRIEAYLAARAEMGDPLPELVAIRTMPGGEQSKNDLSNLEWLLKELLGHKLCRKSVVLAIGGGAVLDCVGFACAVFHRGVGLVRMPTTILSQDDSGVGVKNAVNMFGEKNLIGAFAVPRGVVNDFALIDCLPDRSFHAGFSEAVKVALLKDAAFFEQIEQTAEAIAARKPNAWEPVIERSAQLHLEHICLGGDPFEEQVARPLDFGHWSAHRLEGMTHNAVEHGEAVAMGLALDLLWAEKAGHVETGLALRTCRTLAALKIPLFHPRLSDLSDLFEGLESFREHLGGELTLTIPQAPGKPRDHHTVDRSALAWAVAELDRLTRTHNWPRFDDAQLDFSALKMDD